MDEADGMIEVWLKIAFNTGLRVGELKGLKVSDIDFEHKCIYVQRSITGNTIITSSSTKNHNRIVYLSDYVLNLMQEYIKSNNLTNWLFETNQKTFYKSSKTIDKYYFQPILRKLGIKGTLGKTRKTFASVAKSYAMEDEAIQNAMGHRVGSSVTDIHYTFPTMTKIQAQKGQENLAPINDVLFGEKVKKA
jgi:integrase